MAGKSTGLVDTAGLKARLLRFEANGINNHDASCLMLILAVESLERIERLLASNTAEHTAAESKLSDLAASSTVIQEAAHRGPGRRRKYA